MVNRPPSVQPGSRSPLTTEIDNDSSFLFSLIQVETEDFPGVLFIIADTILKSGLDIWNTKISTRNRRISDIFYVKDLNGKKITTSNQMDMVKARLRNAFHSLQYI